MTEARSFLNYKIPEGLDVHAVKKKPAVVQAALVTEENIPLIVEWITSNGHAATAGNGQLTIQTLEGPFTARIGSQVMCGLQGEFYAHEGGEFFRTAYDDLGPVEQ